MNHAGELAHKSIIVSKISKKKIKEKIGKDRIRRKEHLIILRRFKK